MGTSPGWGGKLSLGDVALCGGPDTLWTQPTQNWGFGWCPPLKTGSCHRTRRRTTGDTKAWILEQGQKHRSDKSQLDLGCIWKVETDLRSWLPKEKSSVFLQRAPGENKAGSQLRELALGLVCHGLLPGPAGRRPGSHLEVGWKMPARSAVPPRAMEGSRAPGAPPVSLRHPPGRGSGLAGTCSFPCK